MHLFRGGDLKARISYTINEHEFVHELSNTGNELSLAAKGIASIDLSPLHKMRNLREIYLQHNKLKQIDLSPLSSCTKLEILDLSFNSLEKLDLIPLSLCTRIKEMHLGGNNIKELDLTPLFPSLKHNSYLSVDATLDLQTFMYPTLPSISDEIRRLPLEPGWDWTPIAKLMRISLRDSEYRILQYGLLDAIGLRHLGYIDSDLRACFDGLSNEITVREATALIASAIVEKLVGIIDSGGSTIGLDIEHCTQYGDLASRLDAVLHLRQQEMENVEISFFGGEYDLRGLWLTAYGFEILRALKMGFTTDKTGVEKIMNILENSGFTIKVVKNEAVSYPSHVSCSLKKYIWWLVQQFASPVS